MTLPWDIPSDLEIAWLLKQGISETAMISPTVIRAANVTLLDGNTFDFDAKGIRAFLFKELDCDDLIAWNPKRDALATWRGDAFALGQESVFNPATYFDCSALRVHRTPLEWLKADREGIVIVKPQLTYAYLYHARRLSFADPVYAQQVKRWLQPPKPTAELLIEVSAELAA